MSLLTSAARIFDLSLGQMLWSRRSVFLGVVVGGIVMAMFLPIFQLGAVAGGLQ